MGTGIKIVVEILMLFLTIISTAFFAGLFYAAPWVTLWLLLGDN